MANQYESALQDAAKDFPEIEELGIIVLPHVLFHANKAMKIHPGTRKGECVKLIREFIETCNQESLL